MEIICLSNRGGKSARLRVGRLTLVAGVLGVATLVAVALVEGMLIGFADGERAAAAAGTMNYPALAHHFRQESERVDALQQDYERSLATLSARLGRLQAEVVRLNALGGRLVAIGKLDADEFGFDSGPALGGPAPDAPAAAELDDIFESLSQLNVGLEASSVRLNALENLLIGRKLHEDSTPSGRPVTSGYVSSRFGRRLDPVTGQPEFHRGIDFAGRRGTKVVAVAAGIVAFAGRNSAYGNLVEINHGNGFVTRYAHNKRNLVTVGTTVAKGDVIAEMGATGRATGPHVHYEVLKDGKVVNPSKLLAAARN